MTSEINSKRIKKPRLRTMGRFDKVRLWEDKVRLPLVLNKKIRPIQYNTQLNSEKANNRRLLVFGIHKGNFNNTEKKVQLTSINKNRQK